MKINNSTYNGKHGQIFWYIRFRGDFTKRANPVNVNSAAYQTFLAGLHPVSRLAWDVALETGYRVSDIVRLRLENISPSGVVSLTERKTKRRRSVALSPALVSRLKSNAKRGWCFPGDSEGHVHRDTIGRQLRDAAAKVPEFEGAVISMHSARKMYAIALMDRLRDAAAVQRDLGHSNIATTLLYLYGAACFPREAMQ